MSGRKCHLRKPICSSPACSSSVELSRAMMCLSTQGQLFTQRESETYFKSNSRVEAEAGDSGTRIMNYSV